MSLRLRPLLRGDYDAAFAIAGSESALARFRFRGWTPSPESIPDLLFDGVHVQFAVERTSDDGPAVVGLVSSYRYDARNGTTRIAAAFLPSSADVVVPSMLRFVRYLFNEFPLRQCYFEGLQSNLELLSSTVLQPLLELQGRLTDAEWHGGRWHDTLVYRVTRDRFEAKAAPVFGSKWEAIPVGFATPRRPERAGDPDAVRAMAHQVEQSLARLGYASSLRPGDPRGFAELGLDSLALVELISTLESDLDVSILDGSFPTMETIDDAARALVEAQHRSPVRPLTEGPD